MMHALARPLHVAALLAVCVVVATACGTKPATGEGGGDGGATQLDTTQVDSTQTDGAAASDSGTTDAQEQARTSLRAVTFNVLCSFCVFKAYDKWPERVPYLQQIIAEHNADLLGLQELMFVWDDKDEVGDMVAKLPGFAALYYISPKDEGPLPAYADATIYYRKSRFTLVDSGFFWLSPTPDKPYSSGFSAKGSLPRIVAWAALKDVRRKGREVLFVNTHFDNSSPSQAKSAPLFVERLATLRKSSAGAPNPLRDVVAMGDFNSTPSTVAYKTLITPFGGIAPLIDSQVLAAQIEKIGTEEDQSDWLVKDGIDHIFVVQTPEGVTPTVKRWAVDLRRFGPNNFFPSDHWPVLTEVQYP